MEEKKIKKFKSVLMELNCKNSMLFEKLSEAEERLTNVARKTGGDFPITEEQIFPTGVLSHLDAYSTLLAKTENKLAEIFNTISRLEYLCD
jgi:hypothetical protein